MPEKSDVKFNVKVEQGSTLTFYARLFTHRLYYARKASFRLRVRNFYVHHETVEIHFDINHSERERTNFTSHLQP